MAEYTENMMRIARALMPDPPGTRQKQEIHEQVGRVVVELSNAENYLALIFCILSHRVDIDVAKSTFADQGAFEKKLKLVNFTVLLLCNPSLQKLWEVTYQEMHNHRGVRNIIAHQRLYMNVSETTPEVDVALMPLFYKKGGKELRTKEIKQTADALEQLGAKLWSFAAAISKDRLEPSQA